MSVRMIVECDKCQRQLSSEKHDEMRLLMAAKEEGWDVKPWALVPTPHLCPFCSPEDKRGQYSGD